MKKSETQSLPRLQAALENRRRTAAEVGVYQQLRDEALQEVEAFAEDGDIQNLDAVAAVIPRQAQATLAERRLALRNEALAVADQELSGQVHDAKQTLVTALTKIKCALAEKAARSMQQHFQTFQEARRQALSSTSVKEKAAEIYGIENLHLNLEPEESAVRLIEMATGIFSELDKLSTELSGQIPTERELQAV